jgi:uncharacterized protein YkwD
LRRTLAISAATCSLIALSVAPSAPAATDTPACVDISRRPSPATEGRARAAVLCLLNAARAERDAAALHTERHIGRAAQRFAEALDPAHPLTHIGHGDSSPQERLAAAGYAKGKAKAFDAGEALGRSIGTSASPAQRVAAWLADGRTRRILLSSRFHDAGIGVSVAGGKVTYVIDVAARHAG